MTKVRKISELWFVYESMKKKHFEKLINSFIQGPGDHFKLFRSILALKLTKLQAFEISNIFCRVNLLLLLPSALLAMLL